LARRRVEQEETPMTNPRARAPRRRASSFRRRSAASALGALAACGAIGGAWSADTDHGERLARRWCAACHIVAPDQTRGEDNVPPFASIAKMRGFGADQIALFLLNPHPKMPDMQLTRAEREDLAAYIARLGKQEK
jgi:mono/diheme cytochrome c family protein